MTIQFDIPKGKISQIKGKCIPLIGDDIDTDRIIPARFLKCVNFDSLGNQVFEDDRKNLNGKHSFDLPCYEDASILFVNSNFGCGSSREHAPQALMRWGIRAIIGESFAEIFHGNCVSIGIPCFTLDKNSIKYIQEKIKNESLFFEIDINRAVILSDDLKYNVQINKSARNMFLSGDWDATSTLMNNINLIEQKIKDLPYVQFNNNLYV